MPLSDTVDSLPAFKHTLQELANKHRGNEAASLIIKHVQNLAGRLTRHADLSHLKGTMTHLEGLLSHLDALSVPDINSQTGVFRVEHLNDESLTNHFADLFTQLSASLPNVFTFEGDERVIAAEQTIKHLSEIGRYAGLQGNSHVVGLSEAMVDVIQFHKEAILAKAEAGNDQLVKPLLRGFALLRTAFDSPNEPHLSPALIDSTANLRDLLASRPSQHPKPSSTEGASENKIEKPPLTRASEQKTATFSHALSQALTTPSTDSSSTSQTAALPAVTPLVSQEEEE